MPTTGESGRTYHLGFRRGKEHPEKWRFELKASGAVDRTKVRSLRRFYMQPPFDQGNEGSCTANSGCLAAQACNTIDNGPIQIYSRSFMYWYERIILGTQGQDSGADVIDEFDVDSQYGNILDAVWVYDANPSEQPPAGAATATKYKTVAAYQPISAGTQATIDSILTALDNNQPVVIGLDWSDAFTTAYDDGAIVTPSMFQYMGEGHALTIVGWAPPSTSHPNGVFIEQGSWGIASPAGSAQTALWSDAMPGDHYFDASLFTAMDKSTGSPIVSDIFAAVPMTAPATLSSVITPPVNIVAGSGGGFADVVTGAPTGTNLTYVWSWGDGTPADNSQGVTASHTFAVAGNYTVSATATNPLTRATTTASVAISVVAATPIPTPSLKAKVDAAEASLEAVLAGYAKQYPRNASIYNYTISVVQWDQTNQLDPILSGTAAPDVPTVDVPVYSGN